ncbi:Thioesterase/thiol ester dehydrase-isomerase [Tothia fuscella]|uniref:Thioesterase/thiol ester dehydrase-isomerase n=1 Tax=Tothia fuscella TaxID=1048955 RepID=A0A9P4NSI7_9PEZI|nr:Thioesterase/thiol ester dehydrase-isomerase [Tothia fuscella]
MPSNRPTLVRPPHPDSSRAEIENTLELTQLNDIDPDLYTNTQPLWHPPGARGVYGGAVIAQCLAAAMNTVPKNFSVHSMHCYFVLAGNAEIPVVYHVEHVRDGRSYITRTVQARQRAKVIFTTTMSFVREGAGGKELLEHAAEMPFVPEPDETQPMENGGTPFESQRIDIYNNDSPKPQTKRTRQWLRARGKISPAGGHEAHLAALAYMSDSYFIGTVSRVHKLWRIPKPLPRTARNGNGGPSVTTSVKEEDTVDDEDVVSTLRADDTSVASASRPKKVPKEVGMMVSLDHTIYFHNPRGFRADEWIFTENQSSWAGDGRGLVSQQMWSRDGKLIASCVQEGLVRLKQQSEVSSKL